MAKPCKSDLDVFAILKPGFTAKSLPSIKSVCDELRTKYHVISKIDVELWRFAEVFSIALGLDNIRIKNTLSIFDIILKNSSCCIYGDDLSRHVPFIKPGVALANDELIVIYDDIREARDSVFNANSKEAVQYWCRRVMKNIIRAGFCLCMPIIQEQTRDIELCADILKEK